MPEAINSLLQDQSHLQEVGLQDARSIQQVQSPSRRHFLTRTIPGAATVVVASALGLAGCSGRRDSSMDNPIFELPDVPEIIPSTGEILDDEKAIDNIIKALSISQLVAVRTKYGPLSPVIAHNTNHRTVDEVLSEAISLALQTNQDLEIKHNPDRELVERTEQLRFSEIKDLSVPNSLPNAETIATSSNAINKCLDGIPELSGIIDFHAMTFHNRKEAFQALSKLPGYEDYSMQDKCNTLADRIHELSDKIRNNEINNLAELLADEIHYQKGDLSRALLLSTFFLKIQTRNNLSDPDWRLVILQGEPKKTDSATDNVNLILKLGDPFSLISAPYGLSDYNGNDIKLPTSWDSNTSVDPNTNPWVRVGQLYHSLAMASLLSVACTRIIKVMVLGEYTVFRADHSESKILAGLVTLTNGLKNLNSLLNRYK